MTDEKQENVDNPEVMESVEEARPEETLQSREEQAAAEPSAVNELEKLQQELASTRDKMLRIAAESENFKKRMERERETLVKYAGENIFRELLSSIDNLDRALELGSGESDEPRKQLESLLEGVNLTRKSLLSTLEKFGVTPLDSIGKEFDPNMHEALTVGHSDEIPDNHVLQEFVKGYQFKDRLLRPSKVIVSKGPEA